MTRPLRAWQVRAKRDFFAANKRVFLQCATPAAGKTDWALDLATTLRGNNTVQRVVVVVPTDPLRLQWADRASEFGLHLVPIAGAEDYDKAGYDGCVATYQQLAIGAGADLMRRALRSPSVVFLDEATVASSPTAPAATMPTPLHRQEKMLRGEITTLVGKLSYRLGISPEEVNKEIRRANFPKRAEADFAQLQAIHAWCVQRYDGGVPA